MTGRHYLQDQITALRGLIDDKIASSKTAAERAAVLDKVHPAQLSLAKLLEKEEAYQIRCHELLTRETVNEVARNLARALSQELPDEAVDRIAPKLLAIVTAAKNKEQD